MPRIACLATRMLVLSAFTILLGACAAPRNGEEVTVAPSQENAKKDAADKEKDEAKKKEKERKKNERKLARLQRELDVARRALEKARLDLEYTEITTQEAITEAQKQLDLSVERFENFKTKAAPMRIAQSEQRLQRTRDALQESEEEVAQLELMYGQEDFADKTKEIVLERGKRRLQRTRESLTLTEQEFDNLTTFTIPIETREHELRVVDKQQTVEKAERHKLLTLIDKQIAVINAEMKIEQLESDIEDLTEEMEEVAKKEAEKEEAEKEEAK
ncbi:MAG: hypothetical protein JSV78_02920 [Phycisphaerales bacterium]|nr:MAG: hypothetical protein JSV78_02920 [Phycisphaerales bacterium]